VTGQAPKVLKPEVPIQAVGSYVHVMAAVGSLNVVGPASG
jgi:hypothetical protein